MYVALYNMYVVLYNIDTIIAILGGFMSQVKDRLKDHPSLRMLTMVIGLCISAVGVNGFLRQAHLLSGGVTGLATVINYLTGINVGLMTFLINVPIFVFGFIYLKKEFCIMSMLNMIIYSFILGFTQNLGSIIPVEDRKSTRLNSSHANISYAVFCLKKTTTNSATRSPSTPPPPPPPTPAPSPWPRSPSSRCTAPARTSDTPTSASPATPTPAQSRTF